MNEDEIRMVLKKGNGGSGESSGQVLTGLVPTQGQTGSMNLITQQSN